MSALRHDRHDHPGTPAIQRMVEFAPSTGGLALWVRHQAHPPDVKAPLVSTNGTTLFYGVGFEALPIAEQVGLVAHEVLHIALRHPQRFLDLEAVQGDVDLTLFTICADAIVNSALSHLTWLRLPRGAVHLDRLLAETLGRDQTIEAALLEWDVEGLYRAIDDRQPHREGRDSDGRNSDGSRTERDAGASQRQAPRAVSAADRSDGPKAARARALGAAAPRDLLPAPDPDEQPETEAEQTRLWSERLERSHAGDGLHSLLRTLLADLPRVRTPWEQILRAHLARSLSMKRGIAWSRPTRSYIANQGRFGPHGRMPWEPGFSATRPVPRLAVIVDVSGSIEDRLLERFALEIEAMTRRLEAKLILVIGDDRVRRVELCEPGVSSLRAIAFEGRGNTDFTPLLLEADRHRPDLAVVLTDLDGPARFRPRWPVVWAVPDAHRTSLQPFGRKLVLS